MAYTRAQFRDAIRQRLGWAAADTFVTDAELNNYINDSLAELHSLLVTVYRPGQWGVASEPIITVPGTSGYVLATTTFGRLIHVRMIYGTRVYVLQAFDYSTETLIAENRSWTPDNVRYSLQLTAAPAVTITFDSQPAGVYTMLVLYVQGPPVFTADGNTSWMGFDEYVVLDCICKCLAKEESDVSAAQGAKQAFATRIRQQAEPLDLGQAATVQDMRALDEGVSRGDAGWWVR